MFLCCNIFIISDSCLKDAAIFGCKFSFLTIFTAYFALDLTLIHNLTIPYAPSPSSLSVLYFELKVNSIVSDVRGLGVKTGSFDPLHPILKNSVRRLIKVKVRRVALVCTAVVQFLKWIFHLKPETDSGAELGSSKYILYFSFASLFFASLVTQNVLYIGKKIRRY